MFTIPQLLQIFYSVQNWKLHTEKWKQHVGKAGLLPFHRATQTSLESGSVLEERLRSFQNTCFNCPNFADKRQLHIINVVGKNHKGFKGCNSVNEEFNLEEKCAGEGQYRRWLRSGPDFETHSSYSGVIKKKKNVSSGL